MRKLTDWLQKRRMANWIILVCYFLLVMLPHEIVGKYIMQSLGHLSRAALNTTVLLFSLSVFTVFLTLLIRNLLRGSQRTPKLIYLSATLLLIVIVYNTLFVLATEAAHFPQYALLAVLLFPLTMNYQATLFWATILGAVDEAYQYFYLNPTATGYFDFNDVITDLLGAVLGLLFLWSFDINPEKPAQSFFRRPAWITGLGILALGVLLNISGVLSFYPPTEGKKPLIVLMSKVPDSFWSYDLVGDLYFHVVQPLEGVLLIGLLLGFYFFLGKPSPEAVARDRG